MEHCSCDAEPLLRQRAKITEFLGGYSTCPVAAPVVIEGLLVPGSDASNENGRGAQALLKSNSRQPTWILKCRGARFRPLPHSNVAFCRSKKWFELGIGHAVSPSIFDEFRKQAYVQHAFRIEVDGALAQRGLSECDVTTQRGEWIRDRVLLRLGAR